MVVSFRTAKKCCNLCYSDFGKSNNGKAKDRKRRQIKRSDRQAWKKEEQL